MRPIPIHDAQDLRLDPYRAMRDRDLATLGLGFIAEGEVVLRKFVSAGRYRLVSVLLADRRVERLEALLAHVTAPVYVAPQEVLDAICGFPLHRGILALGALPSLPEPAALLDSLGRRAVVVCLFGVANHDNMGGIFRNAAALGADAVLLDARCCDPLYRKAIRVSVGAALSVPFARFGPGADPLSLLAEQGFEVLALTPAGDTPLGAVGYRERTALLLGSEGPGLPEAILARTRRVAIPMVGGFDSLNVATSSAIVLHHLLNARTEALRAAAAPPA